MNRRQALLLPLLAAARPAVAHHVSWRVLRAGGFSSMVAARAGKPWLLVAWSVSCDSCRAQFPLLRTLRADHPGMGLAMLCVDGMPLQRKAGEVLLQAGLEHESQWILAQRLAPALLREVDAAWQGELPRAWTFGADGGRATLPGPLDRPALDSWLAGTG